MTITGGGSIERFGSGGRWEEAYGYSRVVLAGDRAVTAGCTSTVDGEVIHVGDAAGQTRTALQIALDALEEAGVAKEQVVRTRMFVVNREDTEAVGRVHGEVFGETRPAATMVLVAGLLHPDHLVEIEVEAYLGVVSEIGATSQSIGFSIPGL
jgi:enamine deaminase RidA (YjgF/YER057c/UK114 family)